MLDSQAIKHTIEVLYLSECTKSLKLHKPFPQKYFICNNEKEFLGPAYTPLLRLLLSVRENKEIFYVLTKYIDNKKDIPDQFLNELATDFIELLFADFANQEKFAINIMFHIENLFTEMIGDAIKNNNVNAIFERNLFVNKLIKAILVKSEHKDFLKILFSQILSEINKICIQSEQKSNSIYGIKTPLQAESSVKTYIPNTEEIINFVNKIIDSLISNVDNFPIIIKYLIKMIDQSIKSIVFFILGMRKKGDGEQYFLQIVIELLFEKWWLPALMSPTEFGIIACTAPEHSYLSIMLSIMKTLKSVLYNWPMEGGTEFAITVNSYITYKSYFCYICIK